MSRRACAAEAPPPRVAIAAFDVDGTLFSSHAAPMAFLRILRAAGLLGPAALARAVAISLRHRLHLIEDDTARRRGLAMLDGLPEAQAEAMADRLVAELLPLVRREALAEIAALRRRGRCVLLVSASLGLVVSRLAAALGACDSVASELVVVEGRCRAAFVGPVVEGEEKWHALSAWADARFGRGAWQLACAYGDSAHDIALLEHAEQAVAVNPRRRLARAARLRGWRRVAWR